MRFLATLVLATSLTACSHAPPMPGRFDSTGADVRAEDYPHVYASWTRDNRMYDGLENKVFLAASFLTPELRTAIRTAYPDVVGHGSVVTRDELTNAQSAPNTFFLSVYTADRRWNDLDKPKTMWRLSIMTDNGMVDATEVIHVRMDANLREIFPVIGRYDECYLVRFPQIASSSDGDKQLIDDKVTAVKLRMAAAIGETILTYDMVRGQAPVPTTGDAPFPPEIR